MVTRRFLGGVVFDLDFVPSPQIDPAVCIGSTVKLDVYFEILELRVMDNFRTMPWADQGPIYHNPCLRRIRSVEMPPGQILAIEQLHWFAPLRGAGSFQGRRSSPRPGPRTSIGAGRCTRQGPTSQVALENHVVFPLLLLFRRYKGKNARRYLNFGKRTSISPSARELRRQVSTFLAQLQPGGIFMVGRFEGQIP